MISTGTPSTDIVPQNPPAKVQTRADRTGWLRQDSSWEVLCYALIESRFRRGYRGQAVVTGRINKTYFFFKVAKRGGDWSAALSDSPPHQQMKAGSGMESGSQPLFLSSLSVDQRQPGTQSNSDVGACGGISIGGVRRFKHQTERFDHWRRERAHVCSVKRGSTLPHVRSDARSSYWPSSWVPLHAGRYKDSFRTQTAVVAAGVRRLRRTYGGPTPGSASGIAHFRETG